MEYQPFLVVYCQIQFIHISGVELSHRQLYLVSLVVLAEIKLLS